MSVVDRQEYQSWYLQMLEAFEDMASDEREQLFAWERVHLDGNNATSDWPGWEERIGPPPWVSTVGNIRAKNAAGIMCEDYKGLGGPYPRRKRAKVHKKPIPAAIRWQVWERDDFTCCHCGIRKHLSVDHILPESKGGTLDLENLQTLCKRCNSRKGAR